MPVRVQRRRTAGWSAPLDSQGRKPVYVGRGSRWGNPFAIVRQADGLYGIPAAVGSGPWPTFSTVEEARGEAVRLFDLHVGVMGMHEYDADVLASLRRELAGRDLMCWCPESGPCHADVLLALANPAAV
jgi:hypothetical protein